MDHTNPLSTVVFQKPDGSTGELSIHDTDALHDTEGSVDSENIANGSVKTEDIANKAVTDDKLAENAVTATSIRDGAVTLEKLSPEIPEAWESAKMNDPIFKVINVTMPRVTAAGSAMANSRASSVNCAGYRPVAIASYNTASQYLACVTVEFTYSEATESFSTLMALANRAGSGVTVTPGMSVLCIRKDLYAS